MNIPYGSSWNENYLCYLFVRLNNNSVTNDDITKRQCGENMDKIRN
jgi:hypothetical protein